MNPAVDQAIAVDALVLGAVNRCTVDSVDPGGKGVNVSRVLIRLGCPTLALGFAAGVTGDFLMDQLCEERVPHHFWHAEGMTRTNTMIWERTNGRRTRCYLPGARVSERSLGELEKQLALVPRGEFVVFGGSLPPGLADDTYARLTQTLKRRGVPVIVDTSGKALGLAVEAAPYLVKPNVEEAEALLGRRLLNDDDVLGAALELRRRGPQYVVISQGANGAIGAGPLGAWKAIAPSVNAKSSVGSGDSMVAGIVAGLNAGHSLVESLIVGTAAGAATASTPGTHLCGTADVRRLMKAVVVRELAPASLALTGS